MITADLPKSYTPADHESDVRAKWEQSNCFHVEPDPSKKPYSIVIPPPNVTAALHLGHALNNTLQDVLIRYHRMAGFNTLWMPGTDHAGIATQTVVDKRLQTEGKPSLRDYKKLEAERQDGRAQFIAQIQAWKDEYEATISEQLKLMGCSCDYDRQRFTMDEMCAKAVREAFFRLFKDGLIYRGKRLVNWDPVSQTALADDEVEMEEVHGHMHYLRYPLADNPNEHIVVATTRPETMLGDTAVAINPKDPRAKKYVGRTVKLPIVGREVPIIADDYVVRPAEFGGDPNDAKAKIATGFLKVTPAHDPNDYDIGQRHDLEMVNIFAPDASISDQHGWTDVSADARKYIGLSREEGRKQVIAWFKEHDLLEKIVDYTHSVGHSYRTHVPIEPYLSDQWYVKVTDDRLRGAALRAMDRKQFEGESPEPSSNGDGELTFYPARYAKTFQQWHENIRDWCISRQIWWGHRIPVWSIKSQTQLPSTGEFAEWVLAKIESGEIASQHRNPEESDRNFRRGDNLDDYFFCFRSEPIEEDRRVLSKAGLTQDPDVLDTWFSSGLWPLSTMGWPDPSAYPETQGLLEQFNPTSVLCTAREIITLWVSRMVMFNRYFRGGTLPYRDVFIHAMIQDGHGQKMSKSLGNGVDPRDIIHSHGADAMRYALVQMTTQTQDVRMPVDLVCPHCEHAFTPKEIKTSGGATVAAPEQTCPKCSNGMVSAFGVATGQVKATNDRPVARNTSPRFDLGRNFCNKLWNATRFALNNLNQSTQAHGQQSVGLDDLSLVDKWMLARLHRALHTVEDALQEYQFSVYANTMYDLIWGDFCDWYLEAIKPTVKSDPAQQQVLRTVLNAIVRLLHPIMPFVTEALWPHVQAAGPAGLSGVNLPSNDILAITDWPDIACSIDDKAAHDEFARAQQLVIAIRNVRGEHKVPPKKKITLHASDAVRALIERTGPVVPAVAELKAVESIPAERPKNAVTLLIDGEEQLLTGILAEANTAAEVDRLKKELADLEKKRKALEGRLANPGYTQKAPPALVQETKDELAKTIAEIAAKADMLNGA